MSLIGTSIRPLRDTMYNPTRVLIFLCSLALLLSNTACTFGDLPDDGDNDGKNQSPPPPPPAPVTLTFDTSVDSASHKVVYLKDDPNAKIEVFIEADKKNEEEAQNAEYILYAVESDGKVIFN